MGGGRKVSLDKKLELLGKVFEVERLMSVGGSNEEIGKYYGESAWGYSLFHSREYLHMGLTRSGEFHKSDLLGQAKIVDEWVQRTGARKVLELAAGRGGNSLYLAGSNPQVEFVGVDLLGKQLEYAVKAGKKYSNLRFETGDFHDLGRFPREGFGLVFVVEGLCHSKDKGRVFEEVVRVLVEDGVLVVFDGYAGEDSSKLSGVEKEASLLAARGMAVYQFEEYGKVRERAGKAGLEVVVEEDMSRLVLPSLRRFEQMARWALR